MFLSLLFHAIFCQSEEIKAALLCAALPPSRPSAPAESLGLFRPICNKVIGFLSSNQWVLFLMARL